MILVMGERGLTSRQRKFAERAAECYQANRARIEALGLDQQRQQLRELQRRWLVVVIKLTPRALEAFVRQAEFEQSMELRVMDAIANSRERPSAAPVDDTEELVLAALKLDDEESVKKALAGLWGRGWSISACAREAEVDRGTVRSLIRKEKISNTKRVKIIDAFKKQRRR